MVNIIRVCY